ncbi:MAG: hypothetical protein WBG71_09185 [Leeuwenhoekiella sp.]
MKLMFTIPILMLLSLASCEMDSEALQTNDDTSIIQKNTITEKTKKEEVTYEIHLHHTALVYEHRALEVQKKMLQQEIEKGNERAIQQLEKVQQSLKTVSGYLEYTKAFIGRLPIPPAPKPNPCNDPKVLNCPIPVIRSAIAVFEKQEIGSFNLTISTLAGKKIRVLEEAEEYEDGAFAFAIDELKGGSYILTVQKYFEPAGKDFSYAVRFDL